MLSQGVNKAPRPPSWTIHLRGRRLEHLLSDIIAIALCAVIAGAQDWQEVETFGRKRHGWLKGFLKLPHGVPSHDTFERVFDRLDPGAFQALSQHRYPRRRLPRGVGRRGHDSSP